MPLQATTTAEEAQQIAHPPRADIALYNRLARVLGMKTKPRTCLVNGFGSHRLGPIACSVAQGYAQLSYADVTVATDVPKAVLFYLEERQQEFPGVSIQDVWLRTYPLHTLAAVLFGTVGPISPQELTDPRFKGLPQSAIVGQSGLEYYYNRYLQGTNGAEEVQIDALGRSTGTIGRVAPVPGNNLRLSLDVNLQRAGEQALAEADGHDPRRRRRRVRGPEPGERRGLRDGLESVV